MRTYLKSWELPNAPTWVTFARYFLLLRLVTPHFAGKCGLRNSSASSSNVLVCSFPFSSKYNLNALSHDTAIELVKAVIAKGIDVEELYVDTVGPKEKYQVKLVELFPNIAKIVVANKADSLYHVVSAASICAKVIRDRAVKGCRFLEDIEQDQVLGSGYPGGQ